MASGDITQPLCERRILVCVNPHLPCDISQGRLFVVGPSENCSRFSETFQLDVLDHGYFPAGGTANRIMPRNQKLTKVLVGRTIKTVTTEPGSVLVLFDDQSNMKIKTAGPATIPPGGKVKSVHEAKAEFKIDFEDGSSTTLCLADPGSSVAVRDKENAVEYLG